MRHSFSKTSEHMRGDGFGATVVVSLITIAVLFGWACWAVWVRVSLIEVSRTARLEAGRTLQPIQSDVSGRVLTSHMVVGRTVRAGDLLVEIDARTERWELEALAAEHDGLTEQIAALEEEIAMRQSALRDAVSAAGVALEEARASHTQAAVRAEQMEDETRRLSALERDGYVGTVEWLRASADLRVRNADLTARALSRARLAAEGRANQSNQRAILSEKRKTRAELQMALGSVSARLEKLRLEIAKRRVVAPIAGRLGDVALLPPGAYVAVAERLCTIIPDAPMQVVAEFSWATAIGRLRPGLPAQVRLVGFPWMEFGSLRATVAAVATEARSGGVRVELTLDQVQTARVAIEHGLSAEVRVTVDHVTPLELLLRTLGRALSPSEPTRSPGEPTRPLPMETPFEPSFPNDIARWRAP